MENPRFGTDDTVVEIPNPTGKITAPSGAEQDAARAAQRAAATKKMTEACKEDLAKLCPQAKPGSRDMRICLFQNRDSLGEGCSTAMRAMRRGGGGGGRFGGGGGGRP